MSTHIILIFSVLGYLQVFIGTMHTAPHAKFSAQQPFLVSKRCINARK
jgi:hypothetical protein